MGVVFIERNGFKEPQWGSGHDPQAKGSRQAVVEHCIGLLQETINLGRLFQAEKTSQWLQDQAHDEFTQEAKKDGVKEHKVEVIFTFAVLVGTWDMVGRLNGLIQANMYWVGFACCEVGSVEHHQGKEWVCPRLSESKFSEAHLALAQKG